MKTILVLASIWMFVSIIDATSSSTSTSTLPSIKKQGHVTKMIERKIIVRKFRTTTSSTTTTTTPPPPPTTTTTESPVLSSSSTTLLPLPIINIKNNFTSNNGNGNGIEIRDPLMMSNSNRQEREFGLGGGVHHRERGDSSSSSSNHNDNIIDLGEQDIENLDLTKLYDRDITKDDPNIPTVLQFTAPSSTSYMDPNYISKIISQQLGDGYQYTNYTITPSAITSHFSAPFPKDSFNIQNFNTSPLEIGISTGDNNNNNNKEEQHTIRPTKHEFTNNNEQNIHENYQTSGDSLSGTPSKSQEYKPFTTSQGGSHFSSSIQGLHAFNNNQNSNRFSSLKPISVVENLPNYEQKSYNSRIPGIVHTSPRPPTIYVSPNPTITYSTPSPSLVNNSPFVGFLSANPTHTYNLQNPTAIYNIPSPTPGYSSGSPPIKYIPTNPTSNYNVPSPNIGYSSGSPPVRNIPPTQPTYSSIQENFKSQSAPPQKYSAIDSSSVTNEFMLPPAKESTSPWTHYPTQSKDSLPPVKISFPNTDYKESEHKALPSHDSYSTINEQMSVPGLSPAILGGYGVPEENPISEGKYSSGNSPDKYTTSVIRGYSNGQEDYNKYSSSTNDVGPSNTYLPPKDNGPSNTYLPPKDNGPSNTYLPPKENYPSNTYLPPKDTGPSNTYLPPQDTGPSNTYFRPQDSGQSNNYILQKERDTGPSNNYLEPHDTGISNANLPEYSTEDSGPTTVIRHHHHYVNYIGHDLPKPLDSTESSEGYRSPKNIFDTLGGTNNYIPSEVMNPPAIIYGKPAQNSYRLPSTGSIIKFPSSSSESTYDVPLSFGSYNPSPSYGSTSSRGESYGPPPTQSYESPSPPEQTYGPPAPPAQSYGSPPQPNPVAQIYGPPPVSPTYGPPPTQPDEISQERPQIFKTIYVNLPPAEQSTPKPKPIRHRVNNLPPQRHYKIVFIKAPTPPPPEEHEVELPPPPQTKTLIYVLSKKPDPPLPIKFVTPASTEPSKPEVHYIQYKDEEKTNTEGNIVKQNKEYSLPLSHSSSSEEQHGSSFTPGTPLGLSDLGYDISSSESKVQVTTTISEKKLKEN